MGDINITNNFNAPIGQHIDHVDTVNLQMDGDGQFHFGMVEKVNDNLNDNGEELIKAWVRDSQSYLSGNAAYAVLYCFMRDCCDYAGNVTQFENVIEKMDCDFKRNYSCTPGTISNAFRNNPYMHMKIDRWKENGAKERVLRLLEEMGKRL